MTAIEANADGLVGPTHSYAGLAPGNIASTDQFSERRASVAAGCQRRFGSTSGRVLRILPLDLARAIISLHAQHQGG